MTCLRLTAFAAAAACVLAASSASAQAPTGSWFDKTDKNKDGFLDADELAKGFRGASAKPLVVKPPAKDTSADHLFLTTWDSDKDGKISYAEYQKYEQKSAANSRAAANRNRVYVRAGRGGYRSPLRHRGFTRGRGFGTNPFLNALRYQERAFVRQRAAFSNFRRFGVYSPNIRGGHRGFLTHRRGFRRF